MIETSNEVNNPLLVNYIDEVVVDIIEENVNEAEGNIVDQGNNNFQGLEICLLQKL